MPSGAAEAIAALPFAPTAEMLDDAVALLAQVDGGGVLDAALRRDAFARYEDLPVPGARPGRGWKHDYAKMRYDELRWTVGRVMMPSTPRAPRRAPVGDGVDRPALATENAGGIYHIGAAFVDAPSNVDPRVTVKPLDAATARAYAAKLAGVHGSIVDWRADKFAALATAFQNCGAFVHVPAGVVLDAPLQLVFATAPDAEAVFPHVVVIVEAGASATVIERHVGDGDPFVCGIVEVHVADDAQLDYVAVQQTGEAARTIVSRGARCGRNATMRWHLAELGATLARTVIDARLAEPGGRVETSALFFNTKLQHVDLLTSVDHVVGPTTSDTVVRSAATDRGQGRYVGNIVIRPKAHGSDASLRDDALLLSRHAHIDSVPALEIAANDVKAFHGATVGSLDEDALFYVGSRGIPRPEALRLIALGFFEPVIARFPGEALRDEIRTALDAKIDDATEFVS